MNNISFVDIDRSGRYCHTEIWNNGHYIGNLYQDDGRWTFNVHGIDGDNHYNDKTDAEKDFVKIFGGLNLSSYLCSIETVSFSSNRLQKQN